MYPPNGWYTEERHITQIRAKNIVNNRYRHIEYSQTTKGDTRETKKGESCQTTKGDIRQTKKEEVIKPRRGTPVKPNRGTVVKPRRGTSVKAKKRTVVKTQRGTPVKPKRGTVVKTTKRDTRHTIPPSYKSRDNWNYREVFITYFGWPWPDSLSYLEREKARKRQREK